MLSHNVRQLRRVGFVLPIEVWHLNELSKKFCKTIFRKYGLVVCRNLADYGISRYTSRTEAKMLAVAFSTFNNVLLIDQNCVVLEDPTPLFSSQAFLKFGAVFWRGPHDSASWLSGATTKPNHVMFEVIDRPHDPNDIRYTSERGSGVLLVNKAACKLALDLSLIFLSEVGFYDQVAGAKGRELVRFAFLATDHKFYFVPEPVAIADVSDKHAPFLPELFCPNTLILFASKDLLVGSKGQKSRPLFVHKLHDWQSSLETDSLFLVPDLTQKLTMFSCAEHACNRRFRCYLAAPFPLSSLSFVLPLVPSHSLQALDGAST